MPAGAAVVNDYDPDPDLVAFVGEFLRCFGRGIRVKLRVAGAECQLMFPDEPKADEQHPAAP